MIIPVQITWRGLPQSDALEEDIRAKAAKLARFADKIISCRVLVESSYRRHHQGNLYHIRIDMEVPDSRIIVTRAPDQDHAHEDIYVAVRDAFDAARRQLQDYVNRRRGKVKLHSTT